MDRLHLRQLDPFLRKRLHEINMEVLWSFIHERRERDGVANATVNRALEGVRQILNLAPSSEGLRQVQSTYCNADAYIRARRLCLPSRYAYGSTIQAAKPRRSCESSKTEVLDREPNRLA